MLMYIYLDSVMSNLTFSSSLNAGLDPLSQCRQCVDNIFDLQHNDEGTNGGGCKCKECVCHGGTVNVNIMLFSNFELIPF